MKPLVMLFAVLSISAFAKDTQILCGTPFYGPAIILSGDGEVLRASFQNGYSSAKLSCQARRGALIKCSRPSMPDAGGNPLPAYKVELDLDGMVARSEILYPGSAKPIVRIHDNCEAH